MRKNSNPKANAKSPHPPASRPQRAPLRNPNLNQQTRKVLAQHYRAKYGVK